MAPPVEFEGDRERVGELFGALEAVVHVARRGLRPPRVEPARKRGDDRARHRDGLEHDLGQEIAEAFAEERELAGEALERDDGERPEVGAMVDLFGAPRLLGAHVERRADEQTGLGDAVDRPVACPLGDAEIEHLGDLAVVVGNEENVLGLEIAVDDADRVRAREARARRARRCRCVAGGVEAPIALEPAASDSPWRYSIAMYGVPFHTP